MGTAGHVDHGKTALVRLLTGFDCDTHPEEKARGITINLGFTHLDMDEVSIGIIDVPGHKDFIHTMVSGAFGIDFVMLVISSESGVMPQTVEHLNIMQMLGIRNGFVALTKCDLADSETLELVTGEIGEFLKGTFLEGCEIVPVSSVTGFGLERLKETIYKTAISCSEKSSDGFFRMFIDRIFTVKGFGSVVTGTSLGGRITNEETLYLLPPGKKLRVRRIEKHGEAADTVTAGSRVSLNLAGLEKSEYERGMIVSEKLIPQTDLIDAKISFCTRIKYSSCWLSALFFSGTFSAESRIHLIDKGRLEASGEDVIVQIRLREPAVLLRGDRFIIRNSSNDLTLGGGEIIDSYPLHHRRCPRKLIAKLERLSNGGTGEFVMHELGKNRLMLPLKYFSEILFINESSLLETLRNSLPEEILLLEKKGENYLIHKEKITSFEKKILQAIESYHIRNPLDELGRTREELMHVFKGYDLSYASILLDVILENFLKLGLIRKEEDTFVLARHNLALKESVKKEIEFIENYYRQSSMRVPVASEVLSEAEKYGITPEKYKQIMNYLTSKKKVTFISGSYIYSGTVERCRNALLKHLYCTGRPVTVAEFRDLTNGNRKMCLLLLNIFDTEGLTQRDGDYRTITEKGKMYVENLKKENYE